jgi:hypothetical protein
VHGGLETEAVNRKGAQNDHAESGSSAEDAAAALRRLLEAVDAGEIEADTPQARRLLRRLEGAQAAWEVENSE